MAEKLDRTIQNVFQSGLCCGCATCAGVCPRSAIAMRINDRQGVYEPVIDHRMCIGCSLCYQVCPGIGVDFDGMNRELFECRQYDRLTGCYDQCYLGIAKDKDLRYHGASGGIVSAFLTFALEEGLIDGALITGMDGSNPLLPRPYIARTRAEIAAAACSKYCPVPANAPLRQILESDGRYAVVGLPCHMHGLRKAEARCPELRTRIVFRLGIMCGKNISFHGTRYQLQRMGIERDKIASIKYRGRGWPGYLTIGLQDGTKNEIEYLKYYDHNFNSFVMHRCTLCIDAAAEVSDASFGDAWLDRIRKNDRQGTSIILTRTIQMREALLLAAKRGILEMSAIELGQIKSSQDDFKWKKKDIYARMLLNRLMGRSVPVYSGAKLPPDAGSICRALYQGFGMALAGRPMLWKMLNGYFYLIGKAGVLKNKLFGTGRTA
jgi:coenzyme F420 hydrogenase subunit beta